MVLKATTATNDASLCSTILVVFLGFHPGQSGWADHKITGGLIWKGRNSMLSFFAKYSTMPLSKAHV